MVDVNYSFASGDRVKVVYEKTVYNSDGTEDVEEVEEVGTIVDAPSRKFDWENDDFDFDYDLKRGKATRSVDIDNGHVCQLMYDAGGDRDWERLGDLLEVTRLD